jgi:hypothetical protein
VSVWTIVIFFISFLPAMHDGLMVKARWYNGEKDRAIVFSPSYHCIFTIVPSPFHHRTIAVSTSRFHHRTIVSTIVPLRFHYRTVLESYYQ